MLSGPLTNLWRHEAAIFRSSSCSDRSQDRLQAKRAGEHVPAPAVADVNLSAAPNPRPDIETTALDGKTNRNQQ